MEITKIYRDPKGLLAHEYKVSMADINTIVNTLGFNEKQEAQLLEYLKQKRDVRYLEIAHGGSGIVLNGTIYSGSLFPELVEPKVSGNEEDNIENGQGLTNSAERAEKKETKQTNIKRGNNKK